jgi:pSer/pThr/pTyr-binding forkhead associated (FHA) protein
MLQAKLKVVGGRHHGRVIPLATKKFLIGREQDCHLRPNSELVSRHHCVFTVDDFSVHVRDLGSTNGTYVNDQRVRGEILLNSGDRIRVGKLDFELAIGEPVAATSGRKGSGDSSQLLPGIDASSSETGALGTNDTSFEIPVPVAPEDTGSSIIAESTTPVPASPSANPPAAPTAGDSTVVWTPPASPQYSPEMYPQMGMPYPQAPYQPAYPYMPPGMGYQPQYPYPQMPMGYGGMYPQMGAPMGMYPQPAPVYSPPAQPIAEPEPQEDDPANSALDIRLPDPKTTGAKAAAPPPPPPAPEPPKPVDEASTDGNPLGAATEAKKPEPPPLKPSEGAADILKKYTQRRPV